MCFLIQAADKKNMLDEALVVACENLAQLQDIHNVSANPNLQRMCANWLFVKKTKKNNNNNFLCVYYEQTLTADLAEQVLKNKVCLETEVEQVVVKASHAIHKWYGHCFFHCIENTTAVVRSILSKMSYFCSKSCTWWSDALFFADRKDALLQQPTKSGPCSSQETLSGLQERIKSLKLAVEKAKGILCVPDLEQYCALDTVVNVWMWRGKFSLILHFGFVLMWLKISFIAFGDAPSTCGRGILPKQLQQCGPWI